MEKLLIKYLFLYSLLFIPFGIKAQIPEFLEGIKAENKVYDEAIKTARITAEYSGLQAQTIKSITTIADPNLNLLPVVSLGSKNRIRLTFDEFGEDQQYHYQILHCTYDWKLSEIDPLDYIEGFSQAEIRDYDFSQGVAQNYVRYELFFPNEMMKPKVSGNYLLVVFEEDEERVLLTKRFAVQDELSIGANAQANIARSPQYRTTHHEVVAEISTEDIPHYIMPEEIRVVIQQNGRWDNAIFNPRIGHIRNESLIFDALNTNIFEAGAEYRTFEMTSLLSFGLGVESIRRTGTEDQAQVKVRLGENNNKGYFRNAVDINGGYLINRFNSTNSELEAEYANVHFTYESKYGKLEGDLYVLGALNDWNLDEKSKMIYHPDENAYRLKMQLKQGYYNYAYIFVPHIANAKATFDLVEGNFSEASNQYRIYFYHRSNSQVLSYDRLLKVLTVRAN
ncbi:MAG: DUF5103 domain-containing protein [Flavobacteriales bacterium]|jgi:hypothetical protein|nr:DUF5103 domain-containing protein [Flavobacteriales bacterium]